MPCQQYFSHIETSPRETKKEFRRKGIISINEKTFQSHNSFQVRQQLVGLNFNSPVNTIKVMLSWSLFPGKA